jgi:hypothetical protein
LMASNHIDLHSIVSVYEVQRMYGTPNNGHIHYIVSQAQDRAGGCR